MTMAIQGQRDQFDAVAKRAVPFHKKAMVAALRSEAYRLNTYGIRPYARSWGRGSWKPFSPITPLLRKGRGYGPWVAQFSRYHVDEENLYARIGILGQQVGVSRYRTKPTAGAQRFRPISQGFVASAKRHVSGHAVRVTGKAQRWMAKKILNPTASHFSKYKTVRGASNRYNVLHQAIPSLAGAGFDHGHLLSRSCSGREIVPCAI